MSEVVHPKFQRQVDEFATLSETDQTDLLSALVLEACFESNVELDTVVATIRRHLDSPIGDMRERLSHSSCDHAVGDCHVVPSWDRDPIV